MDALKVFFAKTGDSHGWEHVKKLASMFANYLHLPFTFVCSAGCLRGAPILRDIHMQYVYPWRNFEGAWNLQEGFSDPYWGEGCPILFCRDNCLVREDITGLISERIERKKLTLDSLRDVMTFVPAGGVPELWNDFLMSKELPDEPFQFIADRLMYHRIPHDFWKPTESTFVLLD